MLRKHNYWCFLTKLMNFTNFKNIFRYKFDKNSLILPQKSLSFLKTSFYFSFLHLFSSILYNESKKTSPSYTKHFIQEYVPLYGYAWTHQSTTFTIKSFQNHVLLIIFICYTRTHTSPFVLLLWICVL